MKALELYDFTEIELRSLLVEIIKLLDEIKYFKNQERSIKKGLSNIVSKIFKANLNKDIIGVFRDIFFNFLLDSEYLLVNTDENPSVYITGPSLNNLKSLFIEQR